MKQFILWLYLVYVFIIMLLWQLLRSILMIDSFKGRINYLGEGYKINLTFVVVTDVVRIWRPRVHVAMI